MRLNNINKPEEVNQKRSILIMLIKVVLLIILPFLFAWPFVDGRPFPLSRFMRPVEKNSFQLDEIPKAYAISGGSESIGGSTIFSTLSGVKITPMLTQLCLVNSHKIFYKDRLIDLKNFLEVEDPELDQVLAMSIKYQTTDSEKEDEIYVKTSEYEKCNLLPNERISLNSVIEVKDPPTLTAFYAVGGELYTEHVELIVRRALDYLGYREIIWSWKIYLQNSLILLFAWWVVASSALSIFRYIINNENH